MNDYQSTIASSISLSGKGLHTGISSVVTLIPAPENFGIQFQRTDIKNDQFISAHINYVMNTSRGTTIGLDDETQVKTIEHLMAAIAGAEIDNLLVKVKGPEVPILDGSSIEYTKAIESVGITMQNQLREFIEITERVVFENLKDDIRLEAHPFDSFQVYVEIDYNSSVLSTQSIELTDIKNFKEDFSPARTFCFLHELEYLYRTGAIKGGDLSNALVILEKDIDKGELDHLAAILGKESLPAQKAGILSNTELRFSNEPARHKLLDLLGDLRLLGKPIKGNIFACKPGHTSNIEFAKCIHSVIQEQIKQDEYC